MSSTNSDCTDEIKSWLNVILKNENVKDISVQIQGNTEKGDGYMGDIVFVIAKATRNDDSVKIYDLVLKCSKRSKALREQTPVRDVFINEILLYQEVLPYFIEYQQQKGVKDLFNSVPKYYGSFTNKNLEVLALENMKSNGYEIWPRREALPRRHIDLVVREYGKFHATSLALQHQRPTEFQMFADTVIDVMKSFMKITDKQLLFGTPVDLSHDLLKNDLDDNVLLRWKGLKNEIETIFGDAHNYTGPKVILHGDCWNNNFMFLHQDGEEKIPLKVAFLDWQVSRLGSPIMDLSHFLFTCVSKEDFEVLDDTLVTYHTAFVNQLVRLGIENPDTLYPLDQFLSEWNESCRYGIVMAALLMKVVSTDKDEVVDITEAAENGQGFGHSFVNEIRDKENYKRRIRPIVEYAAKHNLI